MRAETMENAGSLGRVVRAGLLLGWLAAVSVPAAGGEAAREFLEGLRARGYYDMALAYLDQLRASPRCPPELKEAIDY
ncbi:MAG TPA: hypothetical protein EYP56_02325 [Planctomycetaceae bacterium]|nr:hypothetical protein [Planctomycetaceae bacterium]